MPRKRGNDAADATAATVAKRPRVASTPPRLANERKRAWLAALPDTLPRGISVDRRACRFCVVVFGSVSAPGTKKRRWLKKTTATLEEATRLRNAFEEERKAAMAQGGSHNFMRTDEERRAWLAALPDKLPRGISVDRRSCRFSVVGFGTLEAPGTKKRRITKSTTTFEEAIRLRKAFEEERKAAMAQGGSHNFMRTDEERRAWLAALPDKMPKGIYANRKECTFAVTVSGEVNGPNEKRKTMKASTTSFEEAVRLRSTFEVQRKATIERGDWKRCRFLRTDEDRRAWLAALPAKLPTGVTANRKQCTFTVAVSPSVKGTTTKRVVTKKTTTSYEEAVSLREKYEAQREAMATRRPTKARSSSRKPRGKRAAPDESATDDDDDDDDDDEEPIDVTTRSVADEGEETPVESESDDGEDASAAPIDATTRTASRMEGAGVIWVEAQECASDEEHDSWLEAEEVGGGDVHACEETDALQRIRRVAAMIARSV